jgi:hypothetical protein
MEAVSGSFNPDDSPTTPVSFFLTEAEKSYEKRQNPFRRR